MSMTKNASERRLQLIIALITAGMDFFHLGLVYPIFSELIVAPSSAIAWGNESWQRSLIYASLIGAFPFGQCIGSPILGKLSDSYGRRRLLFITVAGSAFGMAICAMGVLYNLPWIILCGRLLGGIMGANLSLAYAAIIDLSTPDTKVKNLALIPLITAAGFVLGPLMVGLLGTDPAIPALGGSLPLWIAVALSIFNWGLLWLLKDYSPDIAKSPSKGSILFRTKGLWKPAFVVFLMVSANFLLVQYIGPFSINQLNSDLETVSWLYVNLSISVAVGHLVITRTLASITTPQLVLPWSLGLLACALVAVANATTLLGLHITLSLAMLCCAVAYTNVFAYLSDQVGLDQQGEMMGLGVSMQCLAEWMPPLAVGIFAIKYPELPMISGAIACIIGTSILLMNKRMSPSNQIPKKEIEKKFNF